MALGNCPQCSRYIEEQVSECPYCGLDLLSSRGVRTKVVMLVLLIGVAVYLLMRQGYPYGNVLAWLRIPSSFASQESPLRTTNAVTNIRAQPHISAPIIGKNRPGDVVSVIAKVGDWHKVRFRAGRIGYISTSLLTPVDASRWLGGVDIGHCDKGYAASGGEYQVTGNNVNLRKGPGQLYSVMRDNNRYLRLTDNMRVIAECHDGAWSRVRVITPLNLAQSHHGWISRRYLGPGAGDEGDTGVSAMARAAYRGNSLSVNGEDFSSRLADIESFRQLAAEAVLADKQCLRVDASELSLKSTLERLVIMVDCRNGQRFYFQEEKLAALRHAASQKQVPDLSVMAER